VTALGAKLARADGRADGLEFDAFAEVFTPEEGSEGRGRAPVRPRASDDPWL
jgi:hypothetical protein